MSFIAIIPARYASTRLPHKPLININGKSMILHVLDRVRESGADRIIVATDHEAIANVVKSVGGEVCMTHTDHKSGTERLAEVVEKYNFGNEIIIVNVQGDEPTIPPTIIRQGAEILKNHQAEIATFATPMSSIKEASNPNVVKVVTDSKGYALYFSRSVIPWHRKYLSQNQDIIKYSFLRHLGVYSYRVSFIKHYMQWESSLIEEIEMLEQLRILWHGKKIFVTTVERNVFGHGVDTPDDLTYVRSILC